MSETKLSGQATNIIRRNNNGTLATSTKQVIIAGWGFWTTSGTNKREEEAVSFGVTFASAPIVTISLAGYKATDATAVSEFVDIAGNLGDWGMSVNTYGISTTAFNAVLITDTGNMTDGWRIGYTWIAIGELA